MTDKHSQGIHGDAPFSHWQRSMTEAWSDMLKIWVPPVDGTPGEAETKGGGADKAGADKAGADTAGGGTTERLGAATEAALKNWRAITAAMSAPESMLSLFKGVGAMPEMLAKLSRSTLNGYMEMQEKALERAGQLGQHLDAYSFTDIDENLFRTWTEIYEKEFSPFFRVPGLGLTREYQERAATATDAYNRYQASLGEFLRLLTLPLGRSFTVLQEKVAALAEEGELPEEGKAYYDLWIKVLEGHYMTLFQTPEYMEALAQTLSNLSAFKNARNAVIEDLLQGLPVPTQSELDDLHEEILRLKRSLRDLKKETHS
jgi:class III poly(R)-hydroxyalkanoic acid synthase PhaE subunit